MTRTVCSLGQRIQATCDKGGRIRRTVPRAVSLVTIAIVVVACGSSRKVAAPSIATVSQNCPDLAKVDELAAFDFAKEYILSRDAAEKLKAAALAAMEIGRLAERLDADFGIACAQIAHDLGDKGDWRSGSDACMASIRALREARAKLGPKAQTRLVVGQPVCLTDAALVTKCASICDSSVPAEKVRAECEQMAGRCDGDCEGPCEAKGRMKCNGICSGTCEGLIKGTCGGRCNGTCDGRRVNGGCLGVCVGTCERGAMSGECRGACAGTCTLAKAGICDGVCSGSCTVELADTKCAGDFKQPEVSTDCRARCDLAAINDTECSRPQVGFVVVGARDRETSEVMKAAIDKSLPSLLEVLQEVGDKGPSRVLNARAVIESARSELKEMARSGGAATAKASEEQLVRCFDGPFKNAATTAASVKVGIDQALAVRDEASK